MNQLPLTLEQLAYAATSRVEDASLYHHELNDAMQQFEINTHFRIAAFLATVAVESGHLRFVEESLYYISPERLAKIFPRAFKSAEEAEPYVRNPKALSEKLYDGYHGRGLIQLTWRTNYQKCSNALGVDFVTQPERLADPKYAALSAAWYFASHGCLEAADRGDMDEVTLLVNGPAKLHLRERMDQYAVALLA